MDLNDCFAKEAHKADLRLSITYAHFLKVLDDRNRKRLIDAQAAWTQYRLADCKAIAGIDEGGSMAPMQYSACWVDVTDERDKELHSVYEEFDH
jgi:uncharacterized protein YecT (DUF1311 family)